MSAPFPLAATPDHAAEIASLHVTSWRETYPGLLPDTEIARNDLPARTALWSTILQTGKARIALLPNIGFAAMGPQRDPDLAPTHPEELLALYILKAHHGQGHGRRLLDHVRSDAPFTAWVLAGNHRAEGFYAAMGGRELRRTTEIIDGMTVTEILLSFPSRQDIP